MVSYVLFDVYRLNDRKKNPDSSMVLEDRPYRDR